MSTLKSTIRKFSRELGILVALGLLVLIFGILEPFYLTPKNLLDIIDQTTINGFLALGITFAIITGGNDLSVGSNMAVSIVAVGSLLVMGVPPILCIVIGIGLGFILGCINGFMVSKMKLLPFIATMGTMSVYRGIAYIFTGGWPVLNIPSSFRSMIDGRVFGWLPGGVILMLVFTAVGYIILKHTKFGTYLYSIGGNEEATRLSGINVDRKKIIAYGICGIGTAFAGLVMLAKLGTGEPTAGQGYELNAIAATAIGGTSLNGGKGSIIGTLLGAIFLQALKVGLVVLGMDTFWQFIATGAIIIIAVFFDVVKGNIDLRRDVKKVKVGGETNG